MAGQQPVKNVTLEADTNVEKTALAQNGSSVLWHALVTAVLIALVLVVAIIVRWIYRKRKYNRLRHYLIPTYTFDPNEEETWDTDIDTQESAIFSGSSPQGYQSIEKIIDVSEPSTSNKYTS